MKRLFRLITLTREIERLRDCVAEALNLPFVQVVYLLILNTHLVPRSPSLLRT
jgi:hypothetical protein